MKLKISALVLISLILPRVNAEASNATFIREIQGLYDSVSQRDPSRPVLNLRLADAYFNEVSSSEPEQAKRYRTKARALYLEALTGMGGNFSIPSGASRSKIEFQLARIYSDEGSNAEAINLYTKLEAQDAVPDIKRESALRLAEALENELKPAALASAEKYYLEALGLCTGQDVCFYCHYRLAWLYHHEEKNDLALKEIKLSLWDSKGQIREEALRDLLAFEAVMPTDGKDALNYVDELSAKLNRPTLYGDLSDSFFAAGNRKAGVYVLDVANRKLPTLRSHARLLEEYYGFRDWDKFDSQLIDASAWVKTLNQNEDPEVEKIIRRLTVQLDGERTTQVQRAKEFKDTVLFYLSIYPNGSHRSQMIDGWTVAETDTEAKLKQIKIWEATDSNPKRLREMRASLAQKAQLFETVAEEMAALHDSATSAAEKEEYSYQQAFALYKNGNFDGALKIFKVLAVPSAKPSQWAIQSEHLALDILGKQKNLTALLSQVRLWTQDARFGSWRDLLSNHRDELLDMKKVESEAEFEWASTLGESKEALAIFKKYCDQNAFLPKSCSNAQVLSLKTGDEDSLIQVLQKQGKTAELASEFEATGRFKEAAEIFASENKKSQSAIGSTLKVALLYELSGMNIERDRILKELVGQLAALKNLGAEEDLIYVTLKDAGMLNIAALKLSWAPANRKRLIDYLEISKNGNADTHKQLLASCEDLGPAWESAAKTELSNLDANQRRITFYGKNSKKKFESRVATLKLLASRGDCYLQETTPQMRVTISQILSQSYDDFAAEIKGSPMPEGIDEETKIGVQRSLEELALSFSQKAKSYADIAKDQNGKIQVAVREPALLSSAPAPKVEVLKTALDELRHNPNSRGSIENLKEYYQASGKSRLASYFQGRLLMLQQGVKQ